MNPKVKIIILNWNGWEDTIECLESLYQIDYPNFDVLVVDNDSKDESIDKIHMYLDGKLKVESKFLNYDPDNKPIKYLEYSEDRYPQLDTSDGVDAKNLYILKNNENYGFAEGNNIAIKVALRSNPDYIMLLNNDTVVEHDFLNKLVEVAEEDEQVGVVGPTIYYYDYKGRTDVPSNICGVVNIKHYPGYYDMVDQDPTVKPGNLECDWVSGAAMMIKTKEVPIKYLNNQLFFGNEDIDMCINLKTMGYKIINVHSSRIWHKEGVSRKKRSSAVIKKVKMEIEVNLKFLKLHNKHYYWYLPVYLLQVAALYTKVLVGKF
ncbi:glycosyl transferase family 2 [Methanobacterium lacus]|uniref:Glycosyl transferase family 2 n=1 Tax=Methanobacterium lacus (strain AL-21) TaxID=877455 RepID=F0T7I2_METLA|nr:glycosyltransferase family 2 protein [Methanobacterium lacus]ADZ09550.1 glycosyl transferase family 2 [Methanobacterium lacus]